MSSPRLLEWDTEFWGFRVGQGERAEDDEWARANVDVMCLLLPAFLPRVIARAEERGYRLKDVRVELSCHTKDSLAWAFPVREGEINALAATARVAHRGSRFYADPSFPDDRCDDLYETWIRNSCAGYADEVLSIKPYRDIGHPSSGYITLHRERERTRIGLIGVAENARGKGLGKHLVEAAIAASHQWGFGEIAVVTQGRNVAAQRLFQACGFRTTSTSLWFHKDFR